MEIEERVKIGNLADYYGKILTEKQSEILEMYINLNLTLNEIAEELNISKQAVKDAVDKAIEALEIYEQKLNFVSRDNRLKQILNEKLPSEIDMATRLQLISILEEK